MSLVGATVRASGAIVPNRPIDGQDGYVMRAIMTAATRNHEFVPGASAGLRTAKQHCGLRVAPSWSGSPAQPQGIYDQPTINTIISLDVPKANRQAWFTSYFSIGAGNTGPIVYTGPAANFRFDWFFDFQVVTNPSLNVIFGVRFVGQTQPKFERATLINASAGQRVRAFGHGMCALTSGTQIWPGARPYNGTVAANALKVARLFLEISEAGPGVAET
jgi:hypothetical protein